MSLQGAIEEMGLCELVQTLSLNRYQGTLRVETEPGVSKFFYLDQGEISLFRRSEGETARTGELLVRAGKLRRDQLDQCLARQKQESMRFGDVVVRLGFATRADIEQVLKQRFEEEFLDVFLLDRGQFEFIFGLSPDALVSPGEKLERIKLNTQGLMLEAMRRVDDWQAKLKELGSLDEILWRRQTTRSQRLEEIELDPSLDVPLSLRQDLLKAIDGKRNVRDLVALAQAQGASSRLAGLAFIHGLKKKGIAQPLEPGSCLAGLADALVAGDVATTSKLVHSVLSKERIELPLVEQYLDFLRQSGRHGFAKRECKQLASRALANGDVQEAIVLYERALEIDPEDTEVLDRLFYAHLRRNDIGRALDVGAMLRPLMSREKDFPVISRIVMNMRELAPQEPRVLELSGLVYQRLEHKDEARTELEKALGALEKRPETETRRVAIRRALDEIAGRPTPKTDSGPIVGVAVKAPAPPPRPQTPRSSKSAKRLVAAAAASAALIMLALGLGWSELAARADLAAGESAGREKGRSALLAALSFYDAAAARLSTVRPEAQKRAAEIRDRLERGDMPLPVATPSPSPSPSPSPESTASPEARVDLDDFKQARRLGNWALASKLAVALAQVPGQKDSVLEQLKASISVKTTPPGARATLDGDPPTHRTPCILDAAPRKPRKLRISKPGFLPVEVKLDMDRFHEIDVQLQRGPSWQTDVGEPLAAVAASDQIVVAAARSGKVLAFSIDEGQPLWSRPAGAGEDSLEDPATPLVSQGTTVVASRTGLVQALDLATGKPRWRLAGAPVFVAPVAAQVAGKEKVLLVRGDRLEVADLSTGRSELSVVLGAQGVAPPAVRPSRAYVLLADGRLASVDLEAGTIVWSVEVPGTVVGAPVLALRPGCLVLATRGGDVVALTLAKGAVLWKRPLDLGPIETGPAVDDLEQRIYVATTAARTAALDPNDGRVLWTRGGPSPAAAPPVRIGSCVHELLRSGEVLELAPGDGSPRGQALLPGGVIASAPAASGKWLVVASGAAVLACERPED